MPAIGIQFHAHPNEILNFAYKSSKKYNLNVWVFAGNKSIPVLSQTFEDLLQIYQKFLSSYSQAHITLMLLASRELENDTTSNNIYQKYPNHITFMIGQLKDRNLDESSFGFISQDKETYGIAKKIANDFKRITFSGATASNSHGSAFYKNHRYTEQARKLNSDGYIMRSLGDAVFSLNTRPL